ncbi:DUF4142 domain-containing protein [Novosphingobium fluoreni]|uniref:DUF4142 domain-containing protein n=1 Tax=Novosphingobium fluoreni TaxID=1391222 RepID=UPI003D9FDA14
MKAFYSVALGALLLASCNDKPGQASADNSTAVDATADNAAAPGLINDPTVPAAPTIATSYLPKAGAGDLFEIESSHAILAKNPGKAVRDFAQTMIDAHTQSTARLKAAAKAAGLTVAPPKLDNDQQAKLDAIKSAGGAAAISTYLSAQREAHAAALALHQGYAASGDTPQLKSAAAEIAPVVQHHIDMLAKLPGA